MGTRLNTTRRSLFAWGRAALGASALPAHVLQGSATNDEGATFRAWEREIALRDRAMAPRNTTDNMVDRLSDERRQFEALIADTPAQTRGAMIVKARRLVEDRGMDLDPFGEDLARQLLRYLEAN